ncbi:MAG: DNA-protecting protein DprA, partial [Candidatus Komeilibacteria bacterium CG10_big_fil_rev_8_21_14_0_10_41_13]
DYKLPTIAITGSSLAWPDLYPRGNFELAKNIVNQGGLLLSEFPPDYKIGRFNFPRRNRIISGLSRAVLIIEAARKSGALITADFALEQNREILVLPQNLDGLNSAGSNNLIKNGGQIITSTEDILAGFDIFYL